MKYSDENLPKNRIEFGSAGGFANQVTSYCLLENGKVLKRNINQADKSVSYEKVVSGQKKAYTACLQQINTSKQKNVNEPANMSYFITIFEEGKVERKMIWGNTENKEMVEMYQNLIKTIQEKK